VHHAGHGREALDLLARQWVDLVFADINMPVMTGEQMIEQMAKDGVLKSIPVVVISTEGSDTRIEHLRALGVAAYLRKPFLPEQFSETVHEVLGISHA
jgi:two-component system chemotaxis response regulator CheY